MMNERVKSFLLYAGKCVTGILLVFYIAALIKYNNYGWGLISVMLILSPDGKDAVTLAIARIKANLVGAVIALICLVILPIDMWSIVVAAVAAIGACYLLYLDGGIRSALAAAIVIMLHNTGKHVWNTALERVIAVFAGCVLGLIITFIFHFKTGGLHIKAAKAEHEE